eukprot:9752744-Alexandrium_andersonii.AAC.1
MVATHADTSAVDRVVHGMLRSMMRGAACSWEGDHPESMTTVELMARWRIPSADTELSIRRLKWLRAMVVNPGSHEQIITALTG